MENEKLKTLEEIKLQETSLGTPIGFIQEDRLRAEAMKWYKSILCPKDTKDWIEMFFNLTEEDLE